MSNLTIHVDRLREGPLEMEVQIKPEGLDLADDTFTFKGKVSGRVVFKMVGGDVLASGELEAHARTACVRCLEPAEVTLHAKVDEIWLKSAVDEAIDEEFNAEEPLTRAYFGDEIELDEAFRELLMAELPDRPLCSENCKGLCPGCGANLNTESCRCAKEVRQARERETLPEWKQKLKNLAQQDNL